MEYLFWSFDVVVHVVETAPDDGEIYIFMVDSQHRKRRVMILSPPDVKSFSEWSLWLYCASKSVLQIHYSMDRLISKGSLAQVVLGKDFCTGENNATTLLETFSASPSEQNILNERLNSCIPCPIPILFDAMMLLIPIYEHVL